MIEVKRHGKYVSEATCLMCNCIITYHVDDVKIDEEGYPYVICPECYARIYV